MRRTLVLALMALALPSTALALSPESGGDFGIGLGGGNNVSGISGKYHLSEKNAIQGVIGGRAGSFSGIGVSADYLFEQPSFGGDENVKLAWNVGLGASLGSYGSQISNSNGTTTSYSATYIGVHAVVGIEVIFEPAPFDLVLEYRPGLTIVPSVSGAYDPITAHLRYWF